MAWYLVKHKDNFTFTRWKSMANLTKLPLYRLEEALVFVRQEDGWPPDQVWKRLEKNSVQKATKCQSFSP